MNFQKHEICNQVMLPQPCPQFLVYPPGHEEMCWSKGCKKKLTKAKDVKGSFKKHKERKMIRLGDGRRCELEK